MKKVQLILAYEYMFTRTGVNVFQNNFSKVGWGDGEKTEYMNKYIRCRIIYLREIIDLEVENRQL